MLTGNFRKFSRFTQFCCFKLNNHNFNTKQLSKHIHNDAKPKNSNDFKNSYDETHTHFGFERVTLKEKFEKVNNVFSAVAEKYDLMNDVMSIGIHRQWKDHLIKVLNPYRGTELLDVAGGTGDVAFRYLNHIKANHDTKSSVTVCDINSEMLRVGQKRAANLGYTDPSQLQWVEGDAQQLPFNDDSFDAYTIAFGIRNVVHIDAALSEAYRVLRRGGMFLCLEFTHVKNPILENAYNWYSFELIPVLGEIIAGDWKSYRYLVESIRQFPEQNQFAAMIESAGFTLVRYENLMMGIAAIHCGFKKS